MLSQIQTILTTHANACMLHANTLAHTQNHKKIHGDDLFLGIAHYLQDQEVDTVFWKLLGISQNVVEDYSQEKYQ